MTSSSALPFVQSDLFLNGIPEPRITRHGAPAYKPAVQKGKDYLRTAIKRFINGHTPNQYDYDKLEPDEIRLLQLRPANNHTEQIICTMFKAKRKAVVNRYEALSYTWGEIPNIHHPILIDDKNPPVVKPKVDLFQAVARVAPWQDKRMKLRRKERRKELEKILSETTTGVQQDGIMQEYDVLVEFERVDAERDKLRIDWEALRENKTLDVSLKEEEKARLTKQSDDLIKQKEKVESRYEKICGRLKTGEERAFAIDMITERRQKILDATQAATPSTPQSMIKEFFVRPNLYSAMVHLRRIERPVNLWIDAICINQQKDGEKEKEEQLSVMAEIYSGASNVCIWLGDSDLQLDIALKFAKRMMDFSQLDSLFAKMDSKGSHLATTPTRTERPNSGDVWNEAVTEQMGDSRANWYYLMRLLRLPWFSRRWIIQEIGLAKSASVHVGTEIIHWDDLCDAINLLNDKADHLRDKTRDHDEFGSIEGLSASTLVKVIGNACRKDQNGVVTMRLLTIESLVCSLLAFDSFYSCDAIYSLLSLSADFEPMGTAEDPDFTIKANFKRSTRDLFISFVRRSIVQTKSLDIICRHWAPIVKNAINEVMILPSWVSSIAQSPFGAPPQAHGRQYGENFVGFYNGDYRRRYNASKDMDARWTIRKLEKSKLPRKEPLKIIPEELKPTRSDPPSDLLNPSAFSDALVVQTPTILPQEDPMKFALEQRKEAAERFTEASTANQQSAKTTPTEARDAPYAQLNTGVPFLPPVGTQTPPSSPPMYVTNPTPAESIAEQARQKQKIPKPPRTPGSPPIALRKGTTIDDKRDRLSGTLSVDGFCIGTVFDISGPMDSVVDGTWVRKLGWISAERNQNSVPDALWRLLVADRGPDGGFAPHWYRRACLHALADPYITDGSGYIKVDKYASRILGEMTARYLRRVDAVIKKRCIFSTTSPVDETEIFGLAPESTRASDFVCILFGCSVPVILRQINGHSDESKADYELIGEAYVHGNMQGEAVETWKKKGGHKTTFNIA